MDKLLQTTNISEATMVTDSIMDMEMDNKTVTETNGMIIEPQENQQEYYFTKRERWLPRVP